MPRTILTVAAAGMMLAGSMDAASADFERGALGAEGRTIQRTVAAAKAAGPQGNRGQAARASGRIINGRDVGPKDAGSWEFSVALRKDGRAWCGASLVSPSFGRDAQGNNFVADWKPDDAQARWAITASHCVFETDPATGQSKKIAPSRFSVISGNVSITAQARVFQKVEQIFDHPDYDDKTLVNDIAVLKLSNDIPDPLPNGTARTSIQLPTVLDAGELYFEGAALSVNGWGTTENGFLSDTLMTVRVPFADQKYCSERYTLAGSKIGPGMYCAGFSTGGYDSCQGDSGGAQFFRKASVFGSGTDDPVLVGVVSWGIGCAEPGLLGVYTNVLTFKPWIEKTVVDNS